MLYRELLHRGNAIVVLPNIHQNGDVVLMVPELCAMHVVYVTPLLERKLMSDYSKVNKRKDRDSSSSESNGQIQLDQSNCQPMQGTV